MKGSCHFSDRKCFGVHDPAKFGTIKEDKDSFKRSNRRSFSEEEVSRIVEEKVRMERKNFLSKGLDVQNQSVPMPSSSNQGYQYQQQASIK